MQSSYFVPQEKMAGYMQRPGMYNQEGIYLYGIADPGIKRLLPPPLELTDPEHPLFYLYAVNIREPGFAPWYMEGGVGVLAKYGEHTGMYFFGLMLSGPGALMGAFAGREGSGLPKKLCERIVVERTDEQVRCFIERNGNRLMDVEMEIGQYNEPACKFGAEGCEKIPGGFVDNVGGCLVHRYHLESAGPEDLALSFYHSPTRYHSWEPGTATVKLASSIDDPWGEVQPVAVLGAAWSVCDNWVESTTPIYHYPQDKAQETFQYLFTGRYDRCMLSLKHQHYE